MLFARQCGDAVRPSVLAKCLCSGPCPNRQTFCRVLGETGGDKKFAGHWPHELPPIMAYYQELLVVVPYSSMFTSSAITGIDHSTLQCRYLHFPLRLGHLRTFSPQAQSEHPYTRDATPERNFCAELNSISVELTDFAADPFSRGDPHAQNTWGCMFFFARKRCRWHRMGDTIEHQVHVPLHQSGE